MLRCAWPLPLFLAVFCALALPHVAAAQCYDGTTIIYWVNGLHRTAANNVEAQIGTQIIGNYSDYWAAYVSGTESLGSTQLNSGYDYAGYGENHIPGSGGTAADWVWNNSPSSFGTGTYHTSSYHIAYSECDDYLDGNHGDSRVVNKPTISGFFSNNAFWNLGPGYADPQITYNGLYYRQSAQLTFNSNCNTGDTCTGPPQWSLTTQNNQTQLSGTTGWQVTIQKGSSQGNCAYQSTLTASLGGLSSNSEQVGGNSPKFIERYSAILDSTIGINSPPTGYITYWTINVRDACPQAWPVWQMPMSESFLYPMYTAPGTTGWDAPNVARTYWDVDDWPNYM